MGEKEAASRKRARRADLQKIILETVMAAGVLSIALVAPNALRSMEKLGLLPGKRQKETIQRSRERLIELGLLKYKNGSIFLTEKGERVLRQLQLSDYRLKKPKKWDGKWRVLIFDIPERRKSLRDKVRKTLITVGCLRLQDSVWLYPYDCEDLITLLKADFQIGKDLLYMIVDSLEYDHTYRRAFGLGTYIH